MHPRTKAKYGEITKCVLRLVAMGALCGAVGGLSGSPSKTNRMIRGYFDYSQQQIRQCLAKLKMRGYVRYDETDLRAPLLLTAKGLTRTRSLGIIDRFMKSKNKKWDYLWRVVAFDVPERKKKYRDLFRLKLGELGFFPYQKSIYVSPFRCEEEIKGLAQELLLYRHVLVAVTPNLGRREEEARRWFSDEVRF
jgi:DNA-binding transcriptional regulator PaaX